jgi:uncharacterized membrane protein
VEPTADAVTDSTESAATAGTAPGWRLLRLIPTVSYPLLAHVAILTRSAGLTIASVGVLAAAVLVPGLLRRSAAAWLAAAAVVAGMVELSRLGAAELALFLPPTLINCYMAWLFGHTLLAGRVPLIELIVRRMHDPEETLDPAISRYAARLTSAWTALFIAQAAANTVLALIASPQGLLLAAGIAPPVTVPLEVWSLFANVLNYLIVGAFFLAEYAYRRRRFPQQPYRDIFDFLRRARATAPAVLRDLGDGAGRGRG